MYSDFDTTFIPLTNLQIRLHFKKKKLKSIKQKNLQNRYFSNFNRPCESPKSRPR